MYICIFHLADEPADHSAEFPNRGIIANHNIERHNTWSRRKVSNKSSYKYNSASQYCIVAKKMEIIYPISHINEGLLLFLVIADIL